MQLYSQMQEEINELKKYCNNEILLVEKCFSIALHYWNKIKHRLAIFTFKQEEEEIIFFKNIRPLFIAAIEYYTLQYQALLFKPSNDPDELALYWLQQLKRVTLFYDRHKEFYHYYLSGQTNNDKAYFTRSASSADTFKKNDFNMKSSSYDDIAARIMAYRQYNSYAEEQLRTLLPENKKEFFIGPFYTADKTTGFGISCMQVSDMWAGFKDF